MSIEKDIENAVYMIQGVFDDMDKDFTIWEYRREIKLLLQAGYFVRHIHNHFRESPETKVICKICNDSIEKIAEERL